MELADILSEESVLVCTDIVTKRDVLEKLADKVAAVTGHPAAEVFEALSDRESLGSTGLGNGIAVPHGKYAPLKGVLAVFIAPVAAPLFVGYLVGIDLMFSGLALLAFAASRRREAWT